MEATSNLQRLTLQGSPLFPHITFSTSVSDLGVMLNPELTFRNHKNLVARKCYHQLCQLQVVSCSLAHQPTPAFVHAFATSLIDCCRFRWLVPWSEFYVRLPVLLGGYPSCFHHCLHVQRATLAAYNSENTVSYHCDGLPVCPSMCPLLPL